MCCLFLYWKQNKFLGRKQKNISVNFTVFLGRKCQVTTQTGCNYKQRDLIQDLVMQGCKRVVCKFDVQRGWIVYIQQSANYWWALKFVRPYNYQWASQLTIINTTEKKKNIPCLLLDLLAMISIVTNVSLLLQLIFFRLKNKWKIFLHLPVKSSIN